MWIWFFVFSYRHADVKKPVYAQESDSQMQDSVYESNGWRLNTVKLTVKKKWLYSIFESGSLSHALQEWTGSGDYTDRKSHIREISQYSKIYKNLIVILAAFPMLGRVQQYRYSFLICIDKYCVFVSVYTHTYI